MASKTKSPLRDVIEIVLLLLVAGIILLLAFLSLTEYSPAEEQEMDVMGQADGTISTNEPFSIVSWNIGYGGLSSEADFFMDGGKNVKTVSEEGVHENIEGIEKKIAELDPDFILLQEVDRSSDRTYSFNEQESFMNYFGDKYASSSALNHYVLFIPYPLPPIGKVVSGIQTLSSVQPQSSTRIQLPCPFPWPVKTANFKRCLLVERFSVENSDAELVLINLHLEAYDDGDGKKEQTEQLRAVMQGELEKGNYVIAGGDFNQIFSTANAETYPRQGDGYWEQRTIDVSVFGDEFQAVMDDTHPTCRSLDRAYDASDDFQYYMIDGYIVSNNVKIDSVETIDTAFQNSDHNPVRLQATLL